MRKRLVLITVLLSTVTADAQEVTPSLATDPAFLESLGFAHLSGDGVDQDSDLALWYFEQAADAGRPIAQTMVGLLYSDGVHFEPNIEYALEKYRLAAVQGVAEAQSAVGVAYFYGIGVEQDVDAALQWLEPAAHQQDTRALYLLGLAYRNAYGVARDADRSFALLRRAAELGSTGAIYEAGQEYLSNNAPWFDSVIGQYWLERGVDAEYVPAFAALGWHLLSGHALQQDLPRALELLDLAGKNGHPYSALWTAEMYEKGLGVEPDSQRARAIRAEALSQASIAEVNSFAWLLSVDPDPTLRNGARAVEIMESRLADTDLRTPAYLDTLAAAYAEAGDFEQAVIIQQEAIDAIPASASEAARAAFIERLELFITGVPYHESR